MYKFVLIFSLITFFFSNAYSQENDSENTKHLVTVAFGYTYIQKGTPHGTEADGVFIPSIGLNYFYSLSQKWKIGFMGDFELGEYIVFEKDLNRKNAIITTAIASYTITKAINIFAGGGMEFEREQNLGIIRFGTEYEFELNKGWVLSPGFIYDFKENYDTWSLSISFGKKF